MGLADLGKKLGGILSSAASFTLNIMKVSDKEGVEEDAFEDGHADDRLQDVYRQLVAAEKSNILGVIAIKIKNLQIDVGKN